MIQQEMTYLIGKSAAYALAGAKLISDTEAAVLSQSAAPVPNTTCRML